MVPLTIPKTLVISVAARLSEITRMTGHDPGDRGLEAELDAVRPRGREELLAVLRDQLLVGGDDVLAGLERAQDVVARRIGAADQLDDDVRAVEDLVEVALRDRRRTPAIRGGAAGNLGDRVGAGLDELGEGAADGSPPQEPDARLAQTSRATRSSRVSRRTTTRASPSFAKITGGRGMPL